MSRLGLRGRIVLGASMLALVAVSVLGVLVWSLFQYREAADTIRVSERSMARANELLKLVLDLETGERGFAVTGDERFLEPWASARREIPRALAEFASFERATEDEGDAREFGDAVTEYLERDSVPLVALTRRDLEAGRRVVAQGEAKRRVDALRVLFADFIEQEELEIEELHARADRYGAWSIGLGLFGIAIAIVVISLFAIYLTGTVVRPVRGLALATGRLAAGELSARVPDTGRREEIGRLGAAFNTMAAVLEENRDELESKNAELEAQQSELGRAVSELGEERDRIVALHRFAARLTTESEVETLGVAILNDLAEACRADVGTFYAAGVNRSEAYRLVSSRGFHPDQLATELVPGEGLAGRTIVEREPAASSFGGGDASVRHELHLPLVQRDRVLGVVSVARLSDPGFSRTEREMLESMAGQAAVALSNALALRRAQRDASVTRAVLDATPDGICLTDVKGQIRLANAPMLELAVELGLPMEGTVHERLLAAADRMTDPEAYRAGMAEIAAHPQREFRQEYELADSGRCYLGYVAPVLDSGGGLLGRIFMLREVTAERESDRLKDELVATVSHELRTPLTSIIGYLELVLNESDDDLSDEQRRFLEIVDRNARRLLAVVGDLLFVAQVEAGRLTLDLEPLDPAVLVAESVEAARPLAEAKEIELVPLADQGLRVNGDRLRLNQLLANLVSNAVKFTAPGGEVEVRARERAGRAVLEVSDTGMGIPEDEQERLFERFFRSSSAASHAIQGTGLGLVICKAIAEAHGGSITFASMEGKGTTFSVALPLAAGVEAPLEAAT